MGQTILCLPKLPALDIEGGGCRVKLYLFRIRYGIFQFHLFSPFSPLCTCFLVF